MKTTFQDVHAGFVKGINFFIGFLLAVIVLIVFCNVLSRYVINASLAWSEEISRMMFIWLAFLGAITAYVNNEHLRLDIFIKIFPNKTSQFLTLVADIVVFLALTVCLKGGIDMTVDSFESGWVSSAVPVPYGYVYLAVPVCAGLMLVESIFKIIKDIKNFIDFVRGGI
ncbi:MAG TPA: TRAP transporter small permease [Nitrospirota bacterium]|nr:TRAP transporter small permease [Nitrospirota bacterium]